MTSNFNKYKKKNVLKFYISYRHLATYCNYGKYKVNPQLLYLIILHINYSNRFYIIIYHH